MNTFKKKSLYAALAGVGALGVTGAAQAVNVNPDGLGQVLIYPYYTVRTVGTVGDRAYNSLLSVVNSTASVKAVKVRFLEGKNSREVLDFNLFLSAKDVWTGSLVPDGAGTRLLTADRSCTLPQIPAAGVAFRNTLLAADGAGAGLDRTTEGYVEIIEMATYTDTSETAENVTHVPPGGTPPGCDDVTDAVAAAEAQPVAGGLFGGMTLVNVNSGTDFTEDAVALDSFVVGRSIYRSAGDTRPTLQDADPVSVAIAEGGLVFTTNWATSSNAADAVSAVLMRESVLNEFVLDDSINAGTDWVITMPTKRFYVANGTGAASKLFQRNFNRTAGSCDDISLEIFDREEQTTITEVDFSPLPEAGVAALCWEANVLTFNNSNVFASQNVSNITTTFPNGWLDVGFFPSSVTGLVHTLVAPAGGTTVIDPASGQVSPAQSATYLGLPAVGFAAQSFLNGGVLVGGTGLLSNYGGTFVHKGHRSVVPTLVPAN
jgi:hypothetical protein